MNDLYENERILPPAFMATTRQKILLHDEVQECALDYYTTSPVVEMFATIGNAAVSLFESFKKDE
ncbi:hypothetical protein IKJ53_05555 [bacterium]|nr:hypothetical protein [bacterium]